MPTRNGPPSPERWPQPGRPDRDAYRSKASLVPQSGLLQIVHVHEAAEARAGTPTGERERESEGRPSDCLTPRHGNSFSMTDRPFISTDNGDESHFEPDVLDAEHVGSRSQDHDRKKSVETRSSPEGLKSRPPSVRSRRESSFNWRQVNGHGHASSPPATPSALSQAAMAMGKMDAPPLVKTSRSTLKPSSWSISLLVLFTGGLGIAILSAIMRSLVGHNVEPKGCRMSYMRPSYLHYSDFDTEHTRFATKYSLYLYREQGVDDESKVCRESDPRHSPGRPFSSAIG